MFPTNFYLKKIQENDGVITPDLIKKVIEAHQPIRNALINKYERYKGTEKGVPIYSRDLKQNETASKINNRLHTPFMSNVVDTKIGYFMGVPISYLNDKIDLPDVVLDFHSKANIEDLDTEKSKLATICGYSAELLYIDRDGEENAKYIKPWEVIFFYEDSMEEPEYSLRYYEVMNDEGETSYNVEFYNSTNILYFQQDGDEYKFVDFEPHMFAYNPLFGEVNNDELQGDCDPVLSLMDAHDRAFSDINSEIEQLRLAYMAIVGMSIGDTVEEQQEFMDKLARTGAIEIDAEGDVKFITKNLNDTIVENHLDRLEKRIEVASKNVNFSEDSFNGLSGVALLYKLFNLESKCKIAENKKKKALRYRYKVLCSAWNVKNVALDYKDFSFGFTRNVFVDYKAEAETLEKLKGNISDETAFSLMSFISDPKIELENMRLEMEEKMASMEGTLPSVDEEETEEVVTE